MDGGRSCPSGSDSRRWERATKAHVAGQDRALDGRRLRGPPKSCAGPKRPSPLSGGGRNASCARAWTAQTQEPPARKEAAPAIGDRSGDCADGQTPPARRPTGRPAPWPRRSASAPVRCSVSGRRTISNRTKCTSSSSPRPEFATKLRDIVGLYVDPSAHAVVLSVDEKSQIQALDCPACPRSRVAPAP